MPDEPAKLTPLPTMSRKARWSVWLTAISMSLYILTCLLPVIIGLLELWRGHHIHSQSRLQSLMLTAVVICSIAMQTTAIVLGACAIRDIRRSAGSLGGMYMAKGGIIASSTLLLALAVLYPIVQQAQEAARRTQCRCYMKQLGLAMHNYHATYGSFPPAATFDDDGQPLLSWRVLILPFLEQGGLYKRFHFDEPWDSPNNLPLASDIPEVFHCLSDRDAKPNCTSYVVAVGDETMFPPHSTVRRDDIKDGPAYTVMVGEIAASTIIWTKPEDLVFDEKFLGRGNFSSEHPGSWTVVMADGSCRVIDEKTSSRILRALMTVGGGEEIGWRDF